MGGAPMGAAMAPADPGMSMAVGTVFVTPITGSWIPVDSDEWVWSSASP